jgi:hypothetical protein
MTLQRWGLIILAGLLAAGGAGAAGKAEKAKPGAGGAVTPDAANSRHRLYTAPDPASSGGIKGEIAMPAQPIELILAIPPDDPKQVYLGEVTGPERREFAFRNLPMARYNLVVIYPNGLYEGLELSREPDTLTAADREKIKSIINASDPFFSHKVIHRLEGTTGRGNVARCIVTLYRLGDTLSEDEVTFIKGYRRTFKVIWLKDVGPGWQVVQKRDLYPTNVAGPHVNPPHVFSAALSRIRVTDSVKDLGSLDLTKQKSRPRTADEGD